MVTKHVQEELYGYCSECGCLVYALNVCKQCFPKIKLLFLSHLFHLIHFQPMKKVSSTKSNSTFNFM